MTSCVKSSLLKKTVNVHSVTAVRVTLHLKLVRERRPRNGNYLVECAKQKFTWPMIVRLCHDAVVLARLCHVPATNLKCELTSAALLGVWQN
jgi:hypothetical protein